MLGPSQRLFRVQRRLCMQADENKNSDRMNALLHQQPRRPLDVRMQQLTDLVIKAGTDPADAKGFSSTRRARKSCGKREL